MTDVLKIGNYTFRVSVYVYVLSYPLRLLKVGVAAHPVRRLRTCRWARRCR